MSGEDVQQVIEKIARCLELQADAVMVECPKCKGKGYHHGFGEHGHDPDWCLLCGGPGWVEHPDYSTHEPTELLKQAADLLAQQAQEIQELKNYLARVAGHTAMPPERATASENWPEPHAFQPDSTKQYCTVCGGSVWGIHRFRG